MIVYFDSGSHAPFSECFRESGVRQVSQYRNDVIRRIEGHVKARLLPRSLVYRDLGKPADDTIIVFDSYTEPSYLDWLTRRMQDKRVILWFWNPVKDMRAFDSVADKVEFWSYSTYDCERYGMRHNTQFYFDSLAREALEEPVRPPAEHPRAIFVGREKGRGELFREIGAMLERTGATFDPVFRQDSLRPWKGKTIMSYREVTDLVREADVLVDCYDRQEAGLSLRPLEAMFWGKKLVTNKQDMCQQDFCDDSWVYVMGEDRDLAEFLATPVRPVDPSVRDRYLLSRWLRRFDEGGERV